MLFGWFGTVIRENRGRPLQRAGRPLVPHGHDVVHLLRGDVLRRVLRRAVLRAAAVVPWLGGEGAKARDERCCGPASSTALADQRPRQPRRRRRQLETIPAWGLPVLNTALLLTSGVTITIAHHALRAGTARMLTVFLAATFLLGFLFLGFQVEEYIHAYTRAQPDARLGHLRLDVLHADRLPRPARDARRDHADGDLAALLKGHFTPRPPLRASKAVAWYWHFVDVVWLGLFLFVYWI